MEFQSTIKITVITLPTVIPLPIKKPPEKKYQPKPAGRCSPDDTQSLGRSTRWRACVSSPERQLTR